MNIESQPGSPKRIKKRRVTMQQPLSKYQKILMELVHLREKDYDGFMDRLYSALSGEFKDMVQDPAPVEEKSQALRTMIQHFQDKEEYEKCAVLKTMVESLNP